MLLHTIVSEYDVFRDDVFPKEKSAKKKAATSIVTDPSKYLNSAVRSNPRYKPPI